MEQIFETPVRSGVPWKKIEALLSALGAEIDESRSGSRIFVLLNNEKAVFHRPHPGKETDKVALVAVKKFLQRAGVIPS